MTHDFADFLRRINIPIEEVALLFHSNNSTEYSRCKNRGMIAEYQRFQCTNKKADYLGNKQYIFSFERDGHKNAIFIGCYINHGRIISKPSKSELTIDDYGEFPFPEWYDWIGNQTPGGHGIQYYYLLDLEPQFADLKDIMIIHDISLTTVQHSEKVLQSKSITIRNSMIDKKYFE